MSSDLIQIQGAVAVVPAKIVPPPRKSEVVKAMALLISEERKKANAKTDQKDKEAHAIMDRLAGRVVRSIVAKKSEPSSVCLNWDRSGLLILFERVAKFSDHPELKAAYDETQKYRTRLVTDPKQIEKELREAAAESGGDRIGAMLADPESRKFLREMAVKLLGKEGGAP